METIEVRFRTAFSEEIGGGISEHAVHHFQKRVLDALDV